MVSLHAYDFFKKNCTSALINKVNLLVTLALN